MNDIHVYKPVIPNVTASQWDGTREDAERIVDWITKWGGFASIVGYAYTALVEIRLKTDLTYSRVMVDDYIVFDGLHWFRLDAWSFHNNYELTDLMPVKAVREA